MEENERHGEEAFVVKGITVLSQSDIHLQQSPTVFCGIFDN